jgi:hypothetical protein
VSVFGANNFFATTASLLVYRDPHASRVRGAVTIDTLAAAPTPIVTPEITTGDDGSISGPVTVSSRRTFRIAGFVETSHGRVTTEVNADVRFTNRQTFTIDDVQYRQQIAQNTTVVSQTRTTALGRTTLQLTQLAWPLDVDFAFAVNPDGSELQTTTIAQKLERTDSELTNGLPTAFHVVSNAVAPSDTLHFDAAGVFTSSTGQVNSQRYFEADLFGGCYSRDLTAAAGVLTSVVDGKECGR